jgi:hypothetical protein
MVVAAKKQRKLLEVLFTYVSRTDATMIQPTWQLDAGATSQLSRSFLSKKDSLGDSLIVNYKLFIALMKSLACMVKDKLLVCNSARTKNNLL